MDFMPNTVTGASRAPSSLLFTKLSEPDAERLLAEVWCILEWHALSSPMLEIRCVDALVNIWLIFESAVDCALVERVFFRKELDPLVAVYAAPIQSVH